MGRSSSILIIFAYLALVSICHAEMHHQGGSGNKVFAGRTGALTLDIFQIEPTLDEKDKKKSNGGQSQTLSLQVSGFPDANMVVKGISDRHSPTVSINIHEQDASDTSFEQLQAVTAQSPIEPEMALIQTGSFLMGKSDGEADEVPEHTVNVSEFFIAKHEVTNQEYAIFLSHYGSAVDNNGRTIINLFGEWNNERCRIKQRDKTFLLETSHSKDPVIFVSWFGAVAYAEWLSRQTGKQYRLPSEAEWEYAAGSGAKEYLYSWGNSDPQGKNGGNIADASAKESFKDWVVWNGYSDGYVSIAPVGSFEPNEFGAYDMTGNVSEWCNDWYGKYDESSNGAGPSSGLYRVKRGGSWFSGPPDIRTTKRDYALPVYHDFTLGFRLAMSR
ncbi:MAG: formylglycine-generating enzyme family protein [Pseudomonadota bacterium]